MDVKQHEPWDDGGHLPIVADLQAEIERLRQQLRYMTGDACSATGGTAMIAAAEEFIRMWHPESLAFRRDVLALVAAVRAEEC